MDSICPKCEEEPANVKCSCSVSFCAKCWELHKKKNQTHVKAGPSVWDQMWSWAKGVTITSSKTMGNHLEIDENAKWFGLVVENSGRNRICSIIETSRFADLREESMSLATDHRETQFPSIVSFIGETGAGKSTLIRALILLGLNGQQPSSELEAPVPGASSSQLRSTTGEVNLYSDPSTKGTTSPRLFADCEGMSGSEPLSAQHQTTWHYGGRPYPIKPRDEALIDRTTAVTEIYPKFLYLASDVICMVTRNPRSWASVAETLLRWGTVGAQHAINQYALPAAIIVLNAPPEENTEWVSDDLDFLTEQFFSVIESAFRDNAYINDLAKKYRAKNIQEIFDRSFSSVHVIYIPFAGLGSLGAAENIVKQHKRLLDRIKSDSEMVQRDRYESYTLFDGNQWSIIFNYVFKHLASMNNEAFDFSQCRSQTNIPKEAYAHIAEFLKCSFGHGKIQSQLRYCASVVALSIVRQAIRRDGKDLLHSSTIFNDQMKATCTKAIKSYVTSGMRCYYSDPHTKERCANYKDGHTKHHQTVYGKFLETGDFVDGPFSSALFHKTLEKDIQLHLDILNQYEQRERKKALVIEYRNALQPSNPWWTTKQSRRASKISCLGCLFAAPEYRFPCDHHLCEECVKFFDDTDADKIYPGKVTLEKCPLCADVNKEYWPVEIRVKPPHGGLRVLSLDGGGVRGIVELVVLHRLESSVGLEIPIGEYFDLIVGTSAGGMIALGIGAHNWDAGTCMDKYRDLSVHGLVEKRGTKLKYVGWLVRLFRHSIYVTSDLEKALVNAYATQRFFALNPFLTESCQQVRVAVTTTVNTADKAELRLFTNYNSGGKGHYLSSFGFTREVARSTSAAPMYFEPFRDPESGEICRDGGLRANNPVQTAVNEAKIVWGDQAAFDLVLSIGSGQARRPSDQPQTAPMVPEWLSSLLKTFISTLNGEDGWKGYISSVDASIKNKSRRLNMWFEAPKEYALDDIKAIPKMEEEASRYQFKNSSPNSFALPQTDSAIHEVALQLRASMFFFHPTSITFSKDHSVAVIEGWICCRLDPNSDPFDRLASLTEGFEIPGPFIPFPARADCQTTFKIETNFQHDQRVADQPIEFRVKFRGGKSVAISGFPTTFGAIQRALQ